MLVGGVLVVIILVAPTGILGILGKFLGYLKREGRS
jgi:hypothetical protein